METFDAAEDKEKIFSNGTVASILIYRFSPPPEQTRKGQAQERKQCGVTGGRPQGREGERRTQRGGGGADGAPRYLGSFL